MRQARRLKRSFFIRPTLMVARELLSKFLVRRIGRKILAGKIVETEAYIGPKDRASHAFGGKVTPRNRAEYLIGGHVYIYLVYGMYWQLNISTGSAGRPECVLIRALEPVIGAEFKIQNSKCKIKMQNPKFLKIASGPGKLCRWLKLDKSFYCEDVTRSKRLWLEDRGVNPVRGPRQRRGSRLWRLASNGVKIKKADIVSRPRLGIDYSGRKWAKKPWRFYIKENPAVSRL